MKEFLEDRTSSQTRHAGTRRKISRRTIYIGTVIAMVAMVGGFALATIGISNSAQNAEGNYISSSGAVTGLTYTSTVLGAVSNPAPSAGTGSASAPAAVVSGTNTFCVSSTCTAGDPAQTVTYTFTTSMSGSIQIEITVTATSGGGTYTLYEKQATTATSGTLVLVWDMGTSTNTITAVTLAAQQCSGATCP
jgi:molybdenum cofactor biosynthesis enzyme